MRIEGKTDQAPKPAAPYSQSILSGSLVAVAGQVGFDPSSREIVSSDAGEQTRRAIDNLTAALGAVGATLDDVIRVGVYLTDISDFQAMNSVYATKFAEPYPARTTVYVGLPPGIKVEIDALATVNL